jgi:drug/metabolite transporter (DMT)-like permease
MTMWLVIATRIVANPAANVFQKLLTRDGARPIAVIFGAHALLSLACVPTFGFTHSAAELLPASGEFWNSITLCAVLAVACNTLLVYALKLGDLSLLGPINAYKSVVSLLPSLILLGEFPEPAALAGIALIVVGSVLLVGNDDVGGDPEEQVGDRARASFAMRVTLRAKQRFSALVRSPGVRYRVAALVVSATEAAVLKRAVGAATPIAAFVWWCVLGAVAAGLAAAWVRPTGPNASDTTPAGEFTQAPRRPSRITVTRYVYLTITTGLMQYCTIVALGDWQVGPVLALFQVSTILSVFFGYRYFAEQHLARRLIGSAIMVVGAVAIVVCRQRS